MVDMVELDANVTLSFECSCPKIYDSRGYRGHQPISSCEIHGSVEATSKYRAFVDSKTLPECIALAVASLGPCVEARLPRPVGCQPMYIADDATVSLDDAGGTRPIAGYFAGTNEDGTVDVVVGDATFKFRNEATAECEQQKTSRSVFCTCAAEYPKGPCAVHAPPYATAAEVVKYLEPPIGPSRANALADRCQTLEDEKRGLEVENSRLRREVERLGRKR